MSEPSSQALKEKASILLVDDHPIVRLGLAQLINAVPDLVVCGEASTGRQAMDLIETIRVDLVLVDISLADCNGVELIKNIVARRPSLRCLALSMYDEALYARRVLDAGGRGYVMKEEVPKTVISAIRRVLAGHVYLSDKISTTLLDEFFTTGVKKGRRSHDLSDRELEIVMLAGRGQSTREIAEKLFVSVKTVEAHYERIKDKLQLKSRSELLRYAMQLTLDRTIS